VHRKVIGHGIVSSFSFIVIDFFSVSILLFAVHTQKLFDCLFHIPIHECTFFHNNLYYFNRAIIVLHIYYSVELAENLEFSEAFILNVNIDECYLESGSYDC
jgi:hypothetical protein